MSHLCIITTHFWSMLYHCWVTVFMETFWKTVKRNGGWVRWDMTIQVTWIIIMFLCKHIGAADIPSLNQASLNLINVRNLVLNFLWCQLHWIMLSQKANRILGCTERGVASRVRKVIVPFCFLLVRPHLECCIQAWDSRCRAVGAGPEESHKDAQSTFPRRKPEGFELLCAGGEKAPGRRVLNGAFHCLKGVYKQDGDQVFA